MSVSSPGPLKFHELASLFPMMTPAEQAELGADMKANGLIDRIVVLDGEILDGRNRYCQIVRLDLDPPTADWRGDPRFVAFAEVSNGMKPLDWVLSKNLNRRHLDEGQRAMVAAKIATLRQGGQVKLNDAGENEPANLPVREAPPPTQAEAAETLHVSERSVRSARRILATGTPELVEAVERGAVAVSAGAEIAALPAEEQAELIRQADPKVFAKIAKERRAVKQAEKRDRRDARQKAMGKANLAAGERKFPVILADPEWKFEVWSEETGMDRAADNHYPTSELDAIKARPVGDIAEDDAVLFLWVPRNRMPDGIAVMTAWGFSYVTCFGWDKEIAGNGFWNLDDLEILLIGTRGSPACPAPGTQWPALIREKKTTHSAKPIAAFEMIEAYFPDAPKIELNRRGVPRDGWWAWGNEVAGDVPRGIAVDGNGFADASHLPLAPRKGPPTRPAADLSPEGRGEGAAPETRKNAKAKPTVPVSREIEAGGVRAIVRFGENRIQFYAVEKSPFPTEIGMVEMKRSHASEQIADGDLQSMEDFAAALFRSLLGDEKDRRLPTTIYRLGRTGPVPVRGGEA